MFHKQPHQNYKLGEKIKYFHYVFVDNITGYKMFYTKGTISKVLGNDVYEVDLEHEMQMMYGNKQNGIATWYKELQKQD